MKSKALALSTALFLTGAQALPAGAAVPPELKRDAAAMTAIAAGAVAAGPVGLLLGALGGAWVGEQIDRADALPATRDRLAAAERDRVALEADLASLQASLAEARRASARYARMALDQLELQTLFRTGESTLSADSKARLGLLADFLAANPDVEVHIAGYADPRGSSDANEALALDRAQAVADALTEARVAAARVAVTGHGETRSRAGEGDLDGYALERRVSIELRRRGAAIAGTEPR